VAGSCPTAKAVSAAHIRPDPRCVVPLRASNPVEYGIAAPLSRDGRSCRADSYATQVGDWTEANVFIT
jgi:hypothetical protein